MNVFLCEKPLKIFEFQLHHKVPLWGRAKPLEEHYYALRATICVCAIPASTAYADCATGAYPKLGSSGSTSYYACNATTGIRTKIYGSTDTTADGGGAFTGSGPGVSSPGGGAIKKRRDCKVSFSILALEFANEVILRKGFGCAKLVCTTYIFASSESKSVAAVATCCAALKAMEMRMPTGHMDENVPKRLMKLEMLDMLKKAGWPMEMKSFWPGERLSFFPRSGMSASGPPASSAGCPDYRGDALLFFPEKWRCLWCLAVRPRRSGIAWSVSGSACSGRRSGSAWSVSRMQCVDKCRTACMFCCFGMSLPQFCARVLPIVMKCPGWITQA